MTIATDVAPARGLSCYTANLAAYLSTEWDARALLARSVRVALRIDLPHGALAFSHHDPPLDELPDGTTLRYAGAPSPAEALDGVAAELDRHGRAVAVVDTARVPWSPAHGRASAPHWVLVEDRRGDEWHVVDDFHGLLTAGEQHPFDGWLTRRELVTAMGLPQRWGPEQERRNALVFGVPTRLPAARAALWLARRAGDGRRAPLEGRWLVGDDLVLPFLADYLDDAGARAAPYLDDLWAVAGHRGFAYRHRLETDDLARDERDALAAAAAAWDDLPRVLRFVVESAERGRPRPALARATLGELLRLEEETP